MQEKYVIIKKIPLCFRGIIRKNYTFALVKYKIKIVLCQK